MEIFFMIMAFDGMQLRICLLLAAKYQIISCGLLLAYSL
ncbi:hypothetical protein SAMN05216602_2056 [Pseudomonas argentinensis]|uniref:Uncharacterized protein n=1 Tax=Phytopseudomonas argentinensis TaxID=289370 RepID=A0A1I3JTW3_9GAMM|nr:hypothetical protein SAMN05216602_2056 [Pseudomonas argentinensis]